MPRRFRPTPSAVIATLALIFAMSGGAYAAKKYLITSTKQISPRVLKSLKGASGKAGPAGPAGPTGSGSTGPAGPAGPAGPTGPGGPAGAPGEKGVQGEQGKNGKEGKEGSPWTAGGTLPAGATETGTWSLGQTARHGAESGELGKSFPLGSISFTIPLAAPLDNAPECGEPSQPACVVHVFEGEAISAGCTGTVVEGHVTDLKAEPGNLCIWISGAALGGPAITATQIVVANPEDSQIGASTHGAILKVNPAAAEGSSAYGTWAVTAA
jgi:hypothetical protein